jgi:hypothetical protein
MIIAVLHEHGSGQIDKEHECDVINGHRKIVPGRSSSCSKSTHSPRPQEVRFRLLNTVPRHRVTTVSPHARCAVDPDAPSSSTDAPRYRTDCRRPSAPEADLDHWHAQASPPSASRDRAWVGAALAAVPHVLILAIMGVGILDAEGTDRGYAALIGVGEIYVVPAALVVALLLRFSHRWRAWSAGVVAGTLSGTALVLIATLIVGDGSTWS